jgi:hypothetical protein
VQHPSQTGAPGTTKGHLSVAPEPDMWAWTAALERTMELHRLALLQLTGSPPLSAPNYLEALRALRVALNIGVHTLSQIELAYGQSSEIIEAFRAWLSEAREVPVLTPDVELGPVVDGPVDGSVDQGQHVRDHVHVDDLGEGA